MVLYEHGGTLSQRGFMQAIIFDLDDTLYDLSRHRAQHLRRAWASWLTGIAVLEADAVITRAVRERIFFADMEQFLVRAGVADATQRSRLVEESRATWFTDLHLDEGVAELLSTLAGSYTLGLITNGPSWTQRAKIEQLHLSQWFPHMLVSGEYGCDKPDGRIFAAMLERLTVDVSAAVMVGDNPDADIRGAHGVGMRAIWIRHSHMVYPDDLAPAWGVVDHVTAIPGVLQLP